MYLTENKYAFTRVFYTLLLITLIKIAFLYFNRFPLWVDEAQYWFWSKFPDTGYYSKPPVIAWIINFFTRFFASDDTFFIRLPGAIIHFFAAIYVYLIGCKLYEERIGFFAALLYLLMPAVTFSGNFISTDAPLALCWAGALYHFITAIEFRDENRFFSWVLFAVWLGAGMLSKYTMIILLFGIGLYLLFRKFGTLFTLNFWFSLILAFFIFLPNLLWNSANGFVSFFHTQENLLNTSKTASLITKLSELNFTDFGEFILAQFLVFGPISFSVLLISFCRKVKTDPVLVTEEKEAKALLIYSSLPVLIFGVILSLVSGAQAHWSAPAYIGFSILVSWFLVRKSSEFWIKFSLFIGVILMLELGAISTEHGINNILSRIKNNPTERLFTWQKFIKPVKQAKILHPDAVIASDERKIIAPLTYALRNKNGNPAIIYKWNKSNSVRDHFDLKYKLPLSFGGNIILITRTFNDEYFERNGYRHTLLSEVEGGFRIYLVRE